MDCRVPERGLLCQARSRRISEQVLGGREQIGATGADVRPEISDAATNLQRVERPNQAAQHHVMARVRVLRPRVARRVETDPVEIFLRKFLVSIIGPHLGASSWGLQPPKVTIDDAIFFGGDRRRDVESHLSAEQVTPIACSTCPTTAASHAGEPRIPSVDGAVEAIEQLRVRRPRLRMCREAVIRRDRPRWRWRRPSWRGFGCGLRGDDHRVERLLTGSGR